MSKYPYHYNLSLPCLASKIWAGFSRFRKYVLLIGLHDITAGVDEDSISELVRPVLRLFKQLPCAVMQFHTAFMPSKKSLAEYRDSKDDCSVHLRKQKFLVGVIVCKPF